MQNAIIFAKTMPGAREAWVFAEELNQTINTRYLITLGR